MITTLPVTPISPLRRRLIEDMNMRRFSRATQRNYIRDVGRLATFLRRPPEPQPVMTVLDQRLRDQKEAERRIRIRDRLFDDPGRIGERGDGCGTNGREERPAAAYDKPGQEIRREEDRCHDENVEVLDARVRGGDVVDEPDGCKQ